MTKADDSHEHRKSDGIRVIDVTELPEVDRSVIAHFEAALHGARPDPSSSEAAAVAAMRCFVDDLRRAKTVEGCDLEQLREPVHQVLTGCIHWYYPSALIACGLNISSLFRTELTCLRSQVTCTSCLARLQADREICEACRFGAAVNRPHTCDPELEGCPSIYTLRCSHCRGLFCSSCSCRSTCDLGDVGEKTIGNWNCTGPSCTKSPPAAIAAQQVGRPHPGRLVTKEYLDQLLLLGTTEEIREEARVALGASSPRWRALSALDNCAGFLGLEGAASEKALS